ncbi:hypothetical protein [Trichloromonas sp.]|uniref:hypothetical protein n=1 Tax=Trichloromonas sp. TaxID=3069249 RepID=UPI002A3A6E11|nr:hypothetical protein [Trichloromonas sp.]
MKSQISWIDSENKNNELKSRIFALFQTNILDLLKNKFQWMVQHSIPTNVVDNWYYWEYEEYIKLLNEKNKEENDEKEKQEKTQQEKYSNISNFNPNSFTKQYNPSTMMNKFGGNNSAFPRI